MIKLLPFGNTAGFGTGKQPGEYYYSQGIGRTRFGMSSLYQMTARQDSTSIAGMGNLKYFAKANGALYAQDDAGKILKEATPGAYDFSIVRSPASSNGAGLIGDQKSRLMYFGNTTIGLYDGSFNDSFQTGLTSWQHPAETFLDSVYFGNKTSVGLIASDDSMNLSAFTLPTGFSVTALRAGANGLLIGANFGFQGYLILWDGIADRAIADWIPTKGEVIAIDRLANGTWIVLTQRELIVTNGYSSERVFGATDEDLGFASYASGINPQRLVALSDKVLILNTSHSSLKNHEFGRMKPGAYLFDTNTKTMEFVPVSTGNTISLDSLCAIVDSNLDQRILVAFRDNKLAKNYLATLDATGASRSVLITERLGLGADNKSAEAAVLNLSIDTQTVVPSAMTFSLTLKIYAFKRQLWGRQVTNAVASGATKIRVDGSVSTLFNARVGDEVTVLEGPNAGEVRHIASIANDGLNTEEWTVDSAFSNATGTSIYLNVQPFRFVETKTYTTVSELEEAYFNIKNRYAGKKFLLKVLIESSSKLPVEINDSLFVYDELGLAS